MFAFIVNNFPFVMVALAVFASILAVVHNIAQRRAEAAREAEKIRRIMFAREDKARQRREAAERKAANIAKRARAAELRQIEQEQRRKERAANALARQELTKAKQLEKLEILKQIAEQKERALEAARQLKALERGETPDAAPAAAQAAKPVSPDPSPAVSLADFAAEHSETPDDNAAKPFQNEIVSFTGKLSSMTRAQAMERVKQAGGRAYKDMPAGTTLLVVGQNPGETKQAKFDKWIGQCHKITEAQFLKMLEGA